MADHSSPRSTAVTSAARQPPDAQSHEKGLKPSVPALNRVATSDAPKGGNGACGGPPASHDTTPQDRLLNRCCGIHCATGRHA